MANEDLEAVLRMIERRAKRRRRETAIEACIVAFSLCTGLAAAVFVGMQDWPGWPGPAWPFWPQFVELVAHILVAAFVGFLAFWFAKDIALLMVRQVRHRVMVYQARSLMKKAGWIGET
jgi:hypothetical protein